MTYSSLIAALNSVTFGDDPHSAFTLGIRLTRHGKSVLSNLQHPVPSLGGEGKPTLPGSLVCSEHP
jgi:hypothetical protein